MKLKRRFLVAAAVSVMLVLSPLYAKPEVLATVGDLEVTAEDLEQAIVSSPFGTQFATMDEDDQAALRGDLLKRLVIQRLLIKEAERQGLDNSAEFEKDLEDFRLGLLYRHYLDRLREKIAIPEDVKTQMKQQFKGDPDGRAAAESVYRVDRYRALKVLTLQGLKDKYHIRFHEERIGKETKSDTILMEGDKGLKIIYRELLDGTAFTDDAPKSWVKERLYKRAELLLIARLAEDEGVDVSDKLSSYRTERLPAILVEQKIKEWVPSEQVLKAFYKENPQIGKIPERRHIGQLVTASKEEAEALRQRILAGESLFELAGKYSIDPEGKARNGDMGWIPEGTGMPELEQAVAKLKNKEVSEVIETPKGFHLLTVLDRKLGQQRPYAGVKDRVQQIYINKKLAEYTSDLAKKYEVTWNVLEPGKTAAKTE